MHAGLLGAAASDTMATTNTPAGERSEPSNNGGPPGAGAGAGAVPYYGHLDAVDSPLVSDQVNNHARPWFTRGGVGDGLRMYLDWPFMGSLLLLCSMGPHNSGCAYMCEMKIYV